MIDITQALLAMVIISLTVMLTLIGVQVFYILKEFRNTVRKINKVLDDTGVISEAVSKPANMFSSMLLGIKGGAALMKFFKKDEEGKTANQ